MIRIIRILYYLESDTYLIDGVFAGDVVMTQKL